MMITYEKVRMIIDEVDKIPYPKVANLVENKKYANMLYDDFSGQLGEFSAISQYIYEHINSQQDENVSRILRSIAIMEMKHLDIIGDIIKRLGKDPIFVDSKGIAWSSNNIKYNFKDVEEMIKFNIYTEEVAIQGYRKAYLYTNNRSLKKVFERIILDEKTHIRIFRDML